MFLSEHLGSAGTENGPLSFPESFPEGGMYQLSLRERAGFSQEKDGKLSQDVEIIYAKPRASQGAVCSGYYE